MSKQSIWNVPNALTMLRMVLIAVFIWLFAAGRREWALAVFLLAGLTDFLDGYIARKRNLVTSFGKLMDPLADKLMLVSALVCLMVYGTVPVWVVVVVAVKELLMVAGGMVMLRKGIVVQAHMIGKVATVVFLAAVILTFLHEHTAPWDAYAQYAAVALEIAALAFYLISALQKWKNR